MSAALKFRKQSSFLDSLPPAEKEMLERMAERNSREKNCAIYSPEEVPDRVFILLKGRVKVSTFSSNGKEAIKDVIHPGELFGVEGLFLEEKWQDLAVPMEEEVEFLVIRLNTLNWLIRKYPDLRLHIFNHLASRLHRVEKRIRSLTFRNSRDRIIEFLKETAHKLGKPTNNGVSLKPYLTQKDIAHLTTTSRQTVSSVLNDLKMQGFIHYDRDSMLIRDFARLQ